MKITVLTENNSRIDNYLLSEPGLSLLIEAKYKKILFDTGYSDVFIKNAETLGLDFGDITDIVISHGHNDHTRGLTYFELRGVPLIAHPNIFDTKIDENKIHYGCPISEEELGRKYRLNLTNRPFWLNNEFVFLGEIPENKSADIDDTALVHKTNEGIFIITGCSHSGIINIINYAKQVCRDERILGVLGGFHFLKKSKEELEEICSLMLKAGVNPEYPLYPCHCCDLKSKIIMSKFFNVQEVCTGDVLNC
ncbi:TPA: MBL fold metallo-hydrolase [Candidatus Gastranaerophilales bacterium HUM_15]|nr:MAG TPA: MBL fold metallo-hydrolase [Candidatus Gastranaerophilales bacterium HUM_15]